MFDDFWCKMKLRVCLFCFCCFQHTFVESKTTKTFSEVTSSVVSLSSFQRCRQKWYVCLVHFSTNCMKIINIGESTPLEVFLIGCELTTSNFQPKRSSFERRQPEQKNPPQEPGMRMLTALCSQRPRVSSP